MGESALQSGDGRHIRSLAAQRAVSRLVTLGITLMNIIPIDSDCRRCLGEQMWYQPKFGIIESAIKFCARRVQDRSAIDTPAASSSILQRLKDSDLTNQ